jgi:uncharacterized protein involved in exopolysaccharide biosynthesis/Mrp family chromosome partitioning ATPase
MLRYHFIRVLIGCVLGAIAGTLYWHFSPKVYEADTSVFINSPVSQQRDQTAADALNLIGLGVNQPVASELSILKAEGLFKQSLNSLAPNYPDAKLTDASVEQDLYLMYDVEVDRDSRVAQLMVRAHSPEVAAALANDLVSEYNGLRKAKSNDANGKAAEYVEHQLHGPDPAHKSDGIVAKLAAAEQAIRDYKQRNGFIELSTDSQQTAEYQAKLESDINDTNSQIRALDTEIKLEKQDLDKLPPTEVSITAFVKNPQVAQLQSNLTDLENQRADLLKIWTPGSTKVKQIDSQIKNLTDRLVSAQTVPETKSTESHVASPLYGQFKEKYYTNLVTRDALQTRLSALRGALSGVQHKMDALPGQEQELTALTRDADVLRSEYLRLKQQYDMIGLQSESEISPATQLYEAKAEDIVKPIAPLPAKTIPIGAVLGGVVFLLLSLGRESLRSTVRSSSELSTILELPVAGTAPMLSPRKAQARLRSLPSSSYSPMESFRFMAASGMMSNTKTRSVLFTSVGGSVGCSSSAGEYAVASARMGVKTVLVDADLTFATLSSVFDVKTKTGLRDIINQVALPAPDGQVSIPTNHDNLSILPAGSREGLGITDVPVANLEGIVRHLGESADLVVLDCPPLDVLADASRFVPYVDEVFLVVSARRTSLASIARAEGLLRRCGAKSVNVVLTGTLAQEEAFTRKNRYTRGAA